MHSPISPGSCPDITAWDVTGRSAGAELDGATVGVQGILQEKVVYNWGKWSWRNEISCSRSP